MSGGLMDSSAAEALSEALAALDACTEKHGVTFAGTLTLPVVINPEPPASVEIRWDDDASGHVTGTHT